ncbi:MAG: hypothetical protein ACKVTZ_14355, partial [Bacteroidia bacterium]
QKPLTKVEEICDTFGANISHLVTVPHFLYDKPSTVVGAFGEELRFFRTAAISEQEIRDAWEQV